MSVAKVEAYFRGTDMEGKIIIPEQSSATVELAAATLGTEPDRIAKTLSFLQGDKPVLILADGLSRIDNRKYKERFGCKAKMIPAELVEPLVGHEIGGVCPFGIREGVAVYLDESLRKHTLVYPAVGTDHSGVKLTIPELENCSGTLGWVDVCKQP